jgi:hypothetical protein
MSKKLDTKTITNELEGSAFFRTPTRRTSDSATGTVSPPVPPATHEGRDIGVGGQQVVVDQPVSRPVDRSVSQPTEPSAGRLVGRPKAFYITEWIDAQLDEAVRYFQEKHGIKKVDRSSVINAMLNHDEVWGRDALDRLVDRLISQLTRRFVK